YHRSRYAKLDRLDRGPAAFARVGDDRRDAGERLVLLEDPGAEVEQPRAHHAAVAPRLGEPRRIDVELLARREEREAFGHRLHHSVLDAVVDHLGIVP